MRTHRPRRCAGNAPESMSRRTVRVDVLKSSAVSSIVRSFVRDRLRVPVPVICADPLVEAGRCAGLKVRWVMFASPHPPCSCLARIWAVTQPGIAERRRETRRPCRLYARSSIAPLHRHWDRDDAVRRARGADIQSMVKAKRGCCACGVDGMR
jgi:hypothetical protein